MVTNSRGWAKTNKSAQSYKGIQDSNLGARKNVALLFLGFCSRLQLDEGKTKISSLRYNDASPFRTLKNSQTVY